MIGTLQLFTEPALITNSGPGNATMTLGKNSAGIENIERILEQFEGFCTVTRSVVGAAGTSASRCHPPGSPSA